jgi:hypothetical protein
MCGDPVRRDHPGWGAAGPYVNKTGRNGKLERHAAPGYQWTPCADIPCFADGAELELAIPLTALGFTHPPAGIDFKWADNIQQTGDWSDFTLNGDTAPNERFDYRWTPE